MILKFNFLLCNKFVAYEMVLQIFVNDQTTKIVINLRSEICSSLASI